MPEKFCFPGGPTMVGLEGGNFEKLGSQMARKRYFGIESISRVKLFCVPNNVIKFQLLL